MKKIIFILWIIGIFIAPFIHRSCKDARLKKLKVVEPTIHVDIEKLNDAIDLERWYERINSER